MLTKLQTIGKALSDKTRVEILDYVTESHDPVTIQNVADRFKLHPNAARLHLTKLEGANFLKAVNRRNSEGGRPAKLYSAGDQYINIQFPPRQYQLLAEVLLDLVCRDAKESQKNISGAGIKYGERAASIAKEKYLSDLDQEVPELETLVNTYKKQEKDFGCMPDVQKISSNNYELIFYNCIFREMACKNTKAICGFHHAIIDGYFKYFDNDIKLSVLENDAQNGGICRIGVTSNS